MQLPGKNVLVIGAVCFSIIAGTGAYKIAQAARAEMQKKINSGITVSNTDNQPQTADSKLLTALQQAEQDSSTTDTYTNPFAPSPSDTLTDRLSKNFFTTYAQTQTGGDLNADGSAADSSSLVESALASVDTSTMPKEKYSTDDMNIIAGNTAAELRAYGNGFVSIQNDGLSLIKNNPDAYKNNLNAIGSIYTSIAERLIKLPTPVALTTEHLSVVNAFYLSAEDFKLINQQTKDPMKSLLALRQYKDTVERQRQMYTDIETYLKTNGILFSDTEPGYFWNSFDTTASASASSQ